MRETHAQDSYTYKNGLRCADLFGTFSNSVIRFSGCHFLMLLKLNRWSYTLAMRSIHVWKETNVTAVLVVFCSAFRMRSVSFTLSRYFMYNDDETKFYIWNLRLIGLTFGSTKFFFVMWFFVFLLSYLILSPNERFSVSPLFLINVFLGIRFLVTPVLQIH